MTVRLAESYEHCRTIARQRARNFYYSFLLLDNRRMLSICSIYAFMRKCDDLSDDSKAGEEAQAVEALEEWRSKMEAGLRGNYADELLWPAFHDTVNRFQIPPRYFHEMIDGVKSDLVRNHFSTFDELYRYCYQVASVAGLSLVHILGFKEAEALRLAEKCGIAFQLTNILRDLGEDARRGRYYIPLEDLRRFGVGQQDLAGGVESPSMAELLRFEAHRARDYYVQSRPLLAMIEPSTRPSLWALIEIYSRLLGKVEQKGVAVLHRRVRLSPLEKSLIVLRAFLRL